MPAGLFPVGADSFQNSLAMARQGSQVPDASVETARSCLNLRDAEPRPDIKRKTANADASQDSGSVVEAMSAALSRTTCGAVPIQAAAVGGDPSLQVTAGTPGAITRTDSVSTVPTEAFLLPGLSGGLTVGLGKGQRVAERSPMSAAAGSHRSAAFPPAKMQQPTRTTLPQPIEGAAEPEGLLPRPGGKLPFSGSVQDDKALSAVATLSRKQQSAVVENHPPTNMEVSSAQTAADNGNNAPPLMKMAVEVASPVEGTAVITEPSLPRNPAAARAGKDRGSSPPGQRLSSKDQISPTMETRDANAPPQVPAPAAAIREHSANDGRASSAVQPDTEGVQNDFSAAVQAIVGPPPAVASNQVLAGGKQLSQPQPSAPGMHPGVPHNSPPDVVPTTRPTLHPMQILQRMDRAEIRIGLQSDHFGAIRVHTSVSEDRVGAAVTTSHAALRDALVAEAPSLEKAITGHRLHLNAIQVDAGEANSTFNSFGSNEQQAQAHAEELPSRWQRIREHRVPFAAAAHAQAAPHGCRLDVRV